MNHDDSYDDFWAEVEKAAAYARSLPDWKKGGIRLNPMHYASFADDGSGPPPSAHTSTTVEKK